MDLKQVITELRAELESIDQVMAALEKLAELRNRRGTTLTQSEPEMPARRARTRKSSPPARESAASATGE